MCFVCYVVFEKLFIVEVVVKFYYNEKENKR